MPTVPLPTRLSPLDLALVALYLVAITLFGLRFSKSSGKKGTDKSLKSYFLANNTIPWWAIALSIASAETSTLTIISIPGVAFAGDFGFLQVVLGYMLGRVVVAFLFLPRYFRGEMLTAYQLIQQRFGSRLHKLTAGLFLLTRAAAEGVRVFAISIVVGIAIGTGDTLSIAIISALTLLYTFEGGMAAVIWTDVVQMALYVAGTLVALITLGSHAGGWAHIHAVAAPLGKFHWLDFSLTMTKSYTFWAGVLGGTFLTMASHGTDQLMVQRLLAARNLRESRLALLSSGAVIFLQFTLFLLIGAGLYVFYGAHPQAFASGDRIFPTFIVQQMPHGVAGLLVAAILAAAMSNLSAALNSLASTTVIDFIVPFRKNHGVPHVVPSKAQGNVGVIPPTAEPSTTQDTIQDTTHDTTQISRLATLLWALILFAIAVYSIQAGGKGHVVEIALSIASVAYGCLLGVFLLGTLTKYATQTATMIGMLAGFLTNLFLYQATFPHPLIPLAIHIAFTWYVLIGSAMTFAVGTLFSLTLPRPRQAAAFLILLTLTLPSFAAPQNIVILSGSVHSFTVNAAVEGPALLPRTAPGAPGLASETWLSKPPQHPTETYDFTPITTLLTQAIASKQLPGAVVLIGHNGKIVFHQAYGNRKLAGEPGPAATPTPAEPMTEDTIFDMASLTKVIVTTTAILQLYEQKKLDLDAPVSNYLPQFTTTTGAPNLQPSPDGVPHDHATEGSVIVGGITTPPQTPGVPHVVPSAAPGNVGAIPPPPQATTPAAITQATTWKSKITIRQLLTHYSGLPEDISLKDDWGLKTPDKAEALRRAMAAIPYGPPGLTFKYSDINFITLGFLVELLSGQNLDDYADQHVFAPLHMNSTRYLNPAYECDMPKACGLAGSQACADAIAPMPQVSTCGGLKAWSYNEWIPNTAPTAHDNEGTPATNPNYDHLLRGTVHDPTTRRMAGVAGHAGLFSTAHDAAIFCQALLDKLTKNTGPFPLKQSTLQMALRPQAPPTAVASATIFTQDQTTTKGVAQRALGWDLNSAFSRPRGELFPITTATHPGSFGHTGFTGTSLWLDPTSNTYVIVLANAIHPRGGPPISVLRGQIATAAARALGLSPVRVPHVVPSETPGNVGVILKKDTRQNPCASMTDCPGVLVTARRNTIQTEQNPVSSLLTTVSYLVNPEQAPTPLHSSPVLTGIDVLEQTHYAALKSLATTHQNHLRIALLTNQSGVDSHGRRTIDLLLHVAPQIELTKLFTPEHGLSGKQDTEHLQKEEDPTTHLPVLSLYGTKASDRHPKPSDLRNLDAVVIDLQDAGVRFWTYTSVLGYFLEAAAKARLEIVVLDRPNPVGGLAVEGPVSDPGTESYVNFMPIPVRHGMTFGELARFYNANARQVDLDPTLLDARAITIGTPGAPGLDSETRVHTQPGLHANLTVVPMQHWTRDQYYEDTGIPWIPPSPNLRTPRAAILYPALGLIETTNISVGRGTLAPFESIGAPFINPKELTTYLEARHIPGVAITITTLNVAETPEHYPGHGEALPGIHLEVTDRTHFDSPKFGIELLAALHTLYPKAFQLEKAKTLLLNAEVLAALKSNQDPQDIEQTWQTALKLFVTQRAQTLLY